MNKKISKEIDWSSGYQQSAKTVGKVILSSDVSQFVVDPSGNLAPKVDIIRNLCINNCSGNGNCSINGVCVCKLGYSRADCSIKLSNAPVFLKTMYQNDTYDLKNGTLRDAILKLEKFETGVMSSVVKTTALVNKIFNYSIFI